MKTFALFWIFGWLLGSGIGRLLILALVLWYLDNRYFGLMAAAWAPVLRAQRTAALRRAVEVNPSDVRSMVELGEVYLRGGKYQTAAEYLQRAMDRGEDSPRAFFLLGAAQVKLGQYAEGRQRLEAALAAKEETAFGEPYVYLLEEAFATGGANSERIEELVAQFSRFDSVEVLTRAGRICAAAGRGDLARRLFEEAVRNYGYIPPRMRRRERRWLVRARWGLLQAK